MRGTAVVLLIGVAVVAGCLEERSAVQESGVPVGDASQVRWIDPANDTDGLPDYIPLPTKITKLEHLGFGKAGGGQGIWLWNDRAYVSTGSRGVAIFDISNPEAPTQVGSVALGARDVDILNYGNRTVLVLATGGAYAFFDVTEPGDLTKDDVLAMFQGSGHNIAAHRPGHVVYNSRSLGDPPGGAEIIDARDPDNIKLHKTWDFERTAADGTPVLNTGCHDVTVYPETNRAYCAAVTQTLIWDITNPLEPKILKTIDNPLINIHHSAHTILNHSVLVIGDEYGGAVLYACYGHVAAGAFEPSTPTGAVWLYDLTISPPRLLSWVSPPPASPPSTCTAHFGSTIGGDAGGYFAYGWYTAGTLLIDARNPMNPKIVHQDQSGGSVWDARYYRGYVFTGDGPNGLGVLKPVG